MTFTLRHFRDGFLIHIRSSVPCSSYAEALYAGYKLLRQFGSGFSPEDPVMLLGGGFGPRVYHIALICSPYDDEYNISSFNRHRFSFYNIGDRSKAPIAELFKHLGLTEGLG